MTPHKTSRHSASGQDRTCRQVTASFEAAWVRGLAPGRSGIWPHLPKIITKLQNNYKRKSGKIDHSKRNELQKLQNNYKRTFRPAAGRGRTWGLACGALPLDISPHGHSASGQGRSWRQAKNLPTKTQAGPGGQPNKPLRRTLPPPPFD